MENKTVGDGFKIFHISRYLDVVIIYKILNVNICT